MRISHQKCLASESVIESCTPISPAEIIWLGRALQALTDLNLHIPPRLSLQELRDTVARIHTQGWQCLRLVQSRPLSDADRNRYKSRLFRLVNKLKPLLTP